MPKHALLSASSSKQWLNCPPSAKLCAEVPDKGSEFAKQGTEAHALCEYKVLKALGHKGLRDPTKRFTMYDAEMENCTEEYRNFVMEQVEEAKKRFPEPVVLVEQRLDFSRWVPDGFGTGDCLIVSDEIHVIDYKHGLGVLVDAYHNTQMMCYALGALDLYDFFYDIKAIKMTIFQPRRDNISTFTITKKELLSWAENVLAPTAQLAYKGEGEFKAGDHCTFCKIRSTCRKRAEYNLELAKYDFAMPSTLTDTEISAILPKADSLVSWANDVKEYALQNALRGTKYEGYKVVEGKANRKYMDTDAVASAVTKAGFDPYEKKLLGITAMTSLLGKSRFNELLGDLIERPQGKPTLVPENDKRPALDTVFDDFKGE